MMSINISQMLYIVLARDPLVTVMGLFNMKSMIWFGKNKVHKKSKAWVFAQ